ncbi:MAG: dihydrolipoamide acetyltransferase family protein [Dehalococcoidia bacterium]
MSTPIIMPRLGDFMTEGVITKIYKSSGDFVKQGEIIVEIETEKINYDLESIEEGIFYTDTNIGDTILVDDIIGYLLLEGESLPEINTKTNKYQDDSISQKNHNEIDTSIKPEEQNKIIPSTPSARKLAKKMNVDLSLITPTGPSGRISEQDVENHITQNNSTDITPIKPSRIEDITGIRKSIADHMLKSISTTAQLSYFLEIDVTEAQRIRRLKSKSLTKPISLGNVIIKASAKALKKNIKLNSIVNNKSNEILYFDQINIGFAVALDNGLIVPVINDADQKNIFEINSEVIELANRARANKLDPKEVTGGTFTVSILGTVDGFTPILNKGQSAILGLGRTLKKPVVKNNEIVIREMATISLTADHQSIDGADAAKFLRNIQQIIESPKTIFEEN